MQREFSMGSCEELLGTGRECGWSRAGGSVVRCAVSPGARGKRLVSPESLKDVVGKSCVSWLFL